MRYTGKYLEEIIFQNLFQAFHSVKDILMAS